MPDKKLSSNLSDLLIFRSSDLHTHGAWGHWRVRNERQRLKVRYVNLCTELMKFTPMKAEISTISATMDSTAIFFPFQPMASR
jgi:hypothetical protein